MTPRPCPLFKATLLAALLGLLASGCDSSASSLPPPGSDPDPEPDAGQNPLPDAGSMPGPTTPGGYSVSGNKILDANGTVHHFHGVSRPSLEWSANGENLSAADYQLMASWGANVVRIPINQAFYLRNADYAPRIDSNVQWAKTAGLDVILDLHWSDRGTTDPMGGQQEMADQNSIVFWQTVAAKFKGDGRVMFELYNEPHDVTLDVWRNGGFANGYQVAGMQQMYDAIRAQGANNIVIVGGLDFAYNLSGLASHALSGVNIAYATHPYDYSNKLSTNWENDWAKFANLYPIVITEFGITSMGVSGGSCSATQYYSDVINFANQRGIHWVAWAWYVAGCDFPSLISAWNGSPREAGLVVQNALMAY